jgi:adenylate cyclase
MNEHGRILNTALEMERLHNARWINAFRLAGLLIALAIEVCFRLTRPGWIGAPIGLLLGWTIAAAALCLVGVRSPRIARAGSVAIVFVDMPLLYVVIAAIIGRLQAAHLPLDAARLSAHAAMYYIGLLVLASLVLDRRWLVVGTIVAAVCELVLMVGSANWDVGVTVMTGTSMVSVGTVLGYASRRTVMSIDRVADERLRRERLQRYFSPQVAAQLAEPESIGTAGRTHEVTILFCDLRDFTPICETLPAPAVVALLNAFFERMVDVLFAHGGTLDKYLGDGLMAYFGAPVKQTDHAQRAVQCAIAMRAALAALNTERTAEDASPLRMGVGIHTGSVVLGDIGATRRRDYTVVGDAVNVAARLQELTKTEGVDVLVSESTRSKLDDASPLSPPRALHIRGRTAPLLACVPAA